MVVENPLNADHHTVCKFDSIQDSNYIGVRNALKTLVTTIRSTGQHLLGAQGKSQIKQLETLLALSKNHQDDLEFFRKRWTPGTCDWILSNLSFNKWVDESEEGPTMFWLHALPASGKSILSLLPTAFLRSHFACIFQIWWSVKTFAEYLLEDYCLPNCRTASSITSCIKRRTVFNQGVRKDRREGYLGESFYWCPLQDEIYDDNLLDYWCAGWIRSPTTLSWVDAKYIWFFGADKGSTCQSADSWADLNSCRLCICHSRTRKNTFELMWRRKCNTCMLLQSSNRKSLRSWLLAPLEIFYRLISRWLRVMRCNTQEGLDETLDDIPSGMEQPYQRMERTIIEKTRPRDQKLGQIILTWAACSRQPLVLKELAQALQLEFSVMLDLKFTISRVCGCCRLYWSVDHGTSDSKGLHHCDRFGTGSQRHRRPQEALYEVSERKSANIKIRIADQVTRRLPRTRNLSITQWHHGRITWIWPLQSDVPLLLLSKSLKRNACFGLDCITGATKPADGDCGFLEKHEFIRASEMGSLCSNQSATSSTSRAWSTWVVGSWLPQTPWKVWTKPNGKPYFIIPANSTILSEEFHDIPTIRATHVTSASAVCWGSVWDDSLAKLSLRPESRHCLFQMSIYGRRIDYFVQLHNLRNQANPFARWTGLCYELQQLLQSARNIWLSYNEGMVCKYRTYNVPDS